MICIIALVVFSVLAVFSATYRPLAKEAFDCVFRKMTFRKCRTGLDTKLKTALVGKVMNFHGGSARFLYKYFEVFSWLLVILLFASLGYTVYGGYNYAVWGNCNGPTSSSFCVFDPSGSASEFSVVDSDEQCTEDEAQKKELIVPTSFEGLKQYGNPESPVNFVMFGCYACNNTRKVHEAIFEIYDDYKDEIKFTFIELPIVSHTNAFLAAKVANCVYDQDKRNYLKVSKELYERDLSKNETVIKLGLKYVSDEDSYSACLESNSTIEYITNEQKLAASSGVYGTPTFFINEQAIVGPRPKRTFKFAISKAIRKTN